MSIESGAIEIPVDFEAIWDKREAFLDSLGDEEIIQLVEEAVSRVHERGTITKIRNKINDPSYDD